MTPKTWPVITVEVQRALEASAMNLLHRFHVIYNMGPMGIKKWADPLDFLKQDFGVSSWHLRQIKRLNLEDGVYTSLCNIPGRCLNACGIHPQTNLIYCNERPGNDNLVRVDCDVNVAELEASTSPSEMEDFCDLHKWEDHRRLTRTYIRIYIYIDKHTHT